MKKKNVYFLMLLIFSLHGLMAQTITVSGVVSDKGMGGPLPGVNVVEKGSSNGTSSDFDGNYTIQVGSNSTLVFSSLGYKSLEVAVNGQTTLNVSLEEDAEQLGEVVVTALGIKREQKALGYSLTEVDGDQLSTVKQVNAVNALQGKVAGVNITSAATGAAGTSNVVIRGASSLSGSNQPLYVVDGIPIDNTNLGSASRWGGSDYGDGISSINPDDIESISVLKGGSAAALYGSSASNGVIIITTKSGKNQKGFGVEVSSSTLLESVNTDLYDFQTSYGQGTLGVAPTTQEEALAAGLSSWGGALDGSMVPQFDGVSRPYSYSGNNIKKFYDTATTFTNTVSVSKSGEGYNFRFSGTDLTNKDIVPNSGLNRKSFSLNGGVVMSEKLHLDVSGKYVVEDVNNRPRLSDSPGNTNFSVMLSGPNINVFDYKPGYNAEGTEYRISSASTYHQNPYWSAYAFSNESKKNRFIGSSTLKYDILDWLYVMGRAGIDQYTARITAVEPYGTAYKPLGGMTETNYNVKTIDSDVMLGINKDFGENFSTTTILGANSNTHVNEYIELNGQNFVLPGLEDISNVDTKNYSYRYLKSKKGSLYFSTELAYKNYLYLTVTGRQDWFSTLSLAGKSAPNTYFYPSVNTSFVFSDAFDLPEWFSFGKLRAGYSDVSGGVSTPYQLSLAYGITDAYTGQGSSVPLGNITSSELPNAELKPFSKKEYEIGMDLKLFDNRVGIDVAYYFNKTVDDIVPISISNSSGYGSAYVNVGEMTNKGLELLLNVSPIRNDDFGWKVTYNLGYNKNEVVKTDEDGNPFFVGDYSYGVNSQSGAIVGKAYGAIYGTTFVRDEDGNIMYDSDGTPTQGPSEFLGNGVAPWSMGLTNTFYYKNINLSFLIDAKFGADIFSGTSAFANYYGAGKNTLEGRENGLSINGVDTSGAPFSTTIAPENVSIYYQKLYSIAEANMQDADFIKFREISLGYNLPSKLLDKTFISSANISLIGRNLFYLMNNTENIDPESAFNNTSASGIERFGLPSTRSYGVSLNVKF